MNTTYKDITYKDMIRNMSVKRDILKSLLFFIILTLGTAKGWAQDYTGLYYISGNDQGVKSYDPDKTASNYYLCPTVDWLYYDAGATNKFTNVDNEQPFLTSYQYRNGVNDSTEAVWRIQKHATENYYYIIHNKSNRYLVSNASIPTSGANRLRVHLEASIPTDEGYALFAITRAKKNNDYYYYYITPKKFSGWYLNITQGNRNSLQGTADKIDGPTGAPTAPMGTLAYNNVGGTLGLWNSSSDWTSQFFIEDVIVPEPTFTVNASGDVSISSEEGTTIRYTLDGTDPTVSSTTYSTAILSASVLAASSVKAIAVRTFDNKTSAVATLPVQNYTFHIINKSGNIAISSQTVRHPAGYPLTSGYTDIPAEIRSPYISDESIHFYNSTTTNVGHQISATPADGTDIYVTYTTNNLMEKFLHLRGERVMNITIGGTYIYDSGSN